MSLEHGVLERAKDHHTISFEFVRVYIELLNCKTISLGF